MQILLSGDTIKHSDIIPANLSTNVEAEYSGWLNASSVCCDDRLLALGGRGLTSKRYMKLDNSRMV
jgi:hypothetical protein